MADTSSLIKFYMRGDWAIPSQDGYAPSLAQGYLTTQQSTGLARIKRNYKNQPITINATYSLMTQFDVQVFCAFYYGAIASGHKRFIAKLDIGRGLQEYVCQCTGIGFSNWTGYSADATMQLVIAIKEN